MVKTFGQISIGQSFTFNQHVYTKTSSYGAKRKDSIVIKTFPKSMKLQIDSRASIDTEDLGRSIQEIFVDTLQDYEDKDDSFWDLSIDIPTARRNIFQ